MIEVPVVGRLSPTGQGGSYGHGCFVFISVFSFPFMIFYYMSLTVV